MDEKPERKAQDTRLRVLIMEETVKFVSERKLEILERAVKRLRAEGVAVKGSPVEAEG